MQVSKLCFYYLIICLHYHFDILSPPVLTYNSKLVLAWISYRSWQTLTFDRQSASFIRIVGTHNTANEVSDVPEHSHMMFCDSIQLHIKGEVHPKMKTC